MLDNFRKVYGSSDSSKLFRININYISFFLAALSAILQATAIYWIYEPYGWILAGYTGLTFLIGFTAIIAGIRFFTVLYLLAFTPILVPTIYIIVVLSIVINNYDFCAPNLKSGSGCKGWGDYMMNLLWTHEGYLFLGLGAGCLSIPLYVLTIVAFGRLRRHQAEQSSMRIPPVPVFTANSMPQQTTAPTFSQVDNTYQHMFQPTPQPISSPILQHQTQPPVRPSPPMVRPTAAAVFSEYEAPPAYPSDELSFGAAPATFQPTPSTQPVQHFAFEKEKPYKEAGERRLSF